MIAALLLASSLAVAFVVDATVVSSGADDPAEAEVAELQQLPAEELRALLQGLLPPRKGAASPTRDRVLGLRATAANDPRAARLLALFPARVVVDVEGAGKMEAAALRAALTRVFREVGLPLVDAQAEAPTTMRVRAVFDENDRSNSILAGSAMRSFTLTTTGALEQGDVAVLRFAATSNMIGINVGFGAQSGVDAAAGLVCDAALRAAALSITGGLTVDKSWSGRANHEIAGRLQRARAHVEALRASVAGRSDAADAVGALPLRLELAPSAQVDPHVAAVLRDDVVRLLREAGVPIDDGAAAVVRVALDARTPPAPGGLRAHAMRVAVRVADADGAPLGEGADSLAAVYGGNARAALAHELPRVAALIVEAIAATLRGGDAPAPPLPGPLSGLRDVVPLHVAAFAAGTGDVAGDEVLAAALGQQVAGALQRAGVATAPRRRSAGRVVARAARVDDELTVTLSVQSGTKRIAASGASKIGARDDVHDALRAAVEQAVKGLTTTVARDP